MTADLEARVERLEEEVGIEADDEPDITLSGVHKKYRVVEVVYDNGNTQLVKDHEGDYWFTGEDIRENGQTEEILRPHDIPGLIEALEGEL